MGSDQVVCARCGHSTIAGRADVAARTRVAGHVHLLAIFWFVIAAFWVIPAIVMMVLAGVIHTLPNVSDPMGALVARGLFSVLAVAFVAAAGVSYLTGWGLYKMKPWGRTLAIVMAFLAIFHPPFGTALGIYTLFVLLPGPAADEYRRMSTVAESGSTTAAA